MSTPRAIKAYEDREDELTSAFRDNLRKIAFRLARYERGNTKVDVKHADSAFDCLRRFGLTETSSLKSPTFEVTLGSVAGAVALSAPDLVPVLIDARLESHVTQIVVWVAGIPATILYVHGWTRHFLDRP